MIFTFDDLPFEKWNERIDEFHAWMNSEALTSPLYLVIQLFTARLSGALKEWWNSLGENRQQQIYQTTIPALLGEIHREFIGTPNHLKEQLQEVFFSAKCCSLKKRDLAKHFERQTKRYYTLNGLNNPSLKQVYLSSIDEYLCQQTKLYIRDQGQTIEEISIGQIEQYVFRTLDKLCKQKEFWSEFMDRSKHLSKICARPDLSIKCSKSKKMCSCDSRKKHKHFRRPFKGRFNKFRRKRFFRKKRSFAKTTKCFLCHKEGHYAKNCPNKSKKQKQYLINSITSIVPNVDLDNHDLESVLSYDSDDKDALCEYSDSDYSSDSSDNDDGEECCFKITQLPKHDEIQNPNLPVTIFDPSRREDPVHAIAFIDTGAHTSIMNPTLLPSSMWMPHHQEFRVANAGSLSVKLKSKPITIEFFPGCQITTEVLGSSAPGKDLVMGWDTYYALKKNFDISLEPRGMRWKKLYKAFTTIPRLFTIEETALEEFNKIKEEITTISCADSHTDFLQKCSNPLWLNSEFFVKLPFKENVHTTPTRASHAGMPPTLLQQANDECDQLVNQGIVSSTNSPWACKAFYVNNRAEQARGKLRLVIDYKPLNQYLQDVKFPLPNKKALLQHLEGATIFSKFDLKSGFWQIRIHPDERYKTAFCLPNRHLQWNVFPFGLKTAPSLFQQAMLRIFKPLLHTALVYIDDILLFSSRIQDHIQALKQFQDIIKEYGLMLSARKMIIAQPNIDFLGMQINNGTITLQSHLATTLLDFPDENLTKRQVQQFLGVINYVSDFIPQLSQLTRPLQKMLSKNPPLWATRQTDAVKKLKLDIQKLPTLQIPSSGTRILQTDASDKYWGAILFEEINDKRQICGYKSGRFKDSEMHYHSTFKEILAVKKAIEKFEFHLIGHKFRIEMDMSSFPKMLQFKQKMVPHQQLLRWSEWFSKYDFESFYLKGKNNTLADMLSRNPPQELHMMTSSSAPKKHFFDFDANIPGDAHELIERNTLREHLRHKIFEYQSFILSRYGPNCHFIAPLGIHPDYPFAHLYRIENSNMPEEVLCFLWYLCSVYTIGITFDIGWLYQYINALHERDCLSTFLTWFASLAIWTGKLRKSAKATNLPFKKLKGNGHQGGLNPFFNPHTVYFFHRPVQINLKSNKLHALPTLIHHNDYHRGLRPDFNLHDTKPYEDFQTHAFRLNNARQNFHIPFNTNWSYYPMSYQMTLDEDLMFFMDKQENSFVTKATKRDASKMDAPPIIKQESATQDIPQDSLSQDLTEDYFQDAQLPDDTVNIDIDDIGKRFNIDVNTKSDDDFSEPAPEYVCPGDEYGWML
uniref:Reverse transcriptase n=1 Tax=Noccaea caerulescens TaxID=107243 RepID=A0A1J3EQA9_NOCCA